MADFCQQCSIDIFGEDHGDLKPSEPGPLKEGEGWSALCEGCGFTVVDNDGKCIAHHCDKEHGKPK